MKIIPKNHQAPNIETFFPWGFERMKRAVMLASNAASYEQKTESFDECAQVIPSERRA